MSAVAKSCISIAEGMRAAFPSDLGDAAPLGILAGCLRLHCGTTGGRNWLANRIRSNALHGVRLNLLEILLVSFQQMIHYRSALTLESSGAPELPHFASHCSNDALGNCRGRAKPRAAQLAYFQCLGRSPANARRPKPGNCLALEHRRVTERHGLSRCEPLSKRATAFFLGRKRNRHDGLIGKKESEKQRRRVCRVQFLG